jgi:hypothetical protein
MSYPNIVCKSNTKLLQIIAPKKKRNKDRKKDKFFRCACLVAKRVLASSYPPVRLSVYISAAPVGRIFVKFDIGETFVKIYLEKSKFFLQSVKNMEYLTVRPKRVYCCGDINSL